MASRNPKAKHPANQEALNRLMERYQNVAKSGASEHYGYTLSKAMTSLANHYEAITSYKQAMELKNVGKHCASIICPPVANPASSSFSENNGAENATNTKPTRKRKATKLQPTNSKPKKQAIYEEAKLKANDWKKLNNVVWQVILIIDGREQESDHVISKCLMSGIPTEERNLPIGDMAWIAQGRQGGKVVCELMLGTVIERKTPEDLKSSIHNTRYHEQRLRLIHSGLPQLLYLIEGDIQKDLFRCTSDTMQSALWETRLHFGFSVIQTQNMEGTVRQLKRMHRRILQRTFPSSFKNTLPVFHEGFSRHEPSTANRRRQQSLEGMTFEGQPVPPFGTTFINYNELKAKVESDRELANCKVGNVHMKFLKQVANVSDVKCNSIVAEYPTPKSLITGFSETFLAELPTPGLSTRQTTIGPKSALELKYAYGGYEGVVPKTTRNPVSVDSASTMSTSTGTKTVASRPVPSILHGKADENTTMSCLNSLEDKKPAAKRILNTSIGSILMSSDDEMTPIRPAAKTMASKQFQRSSASLKAPPRTVTIDLLDSSTSSDEDDSPPSTKLSTRTGMQTLDTSRANSSDKSEASLPKRNDDMAITVDSSDEEPSPRKSPGGQGSCKQPLAPHEVIEID